MTTTVTIEVDKKTKAGKTFLAMVDTILKNQTGIKVVEETVVNEKTLAKKKATQEEVMELSKEINRAGTKKWFDKLGMDYDSYSR